MFMFSRFFCLHQMCWFVGISFPTRFLFFPVVTRTLVVFFSQHVWSCPASVSRRTNLVALQQNTTLNSVSQMFSWVYKCVLHSYVYIPTCWFACLTVPTPIRQFRRWFKSLRSWSFGMRSECPKSQFDHHGWYLKDERHVASLQIWWFNSLRIWGFLCNMFPSNWRLIKSYNFLSFCWYQVGQIMMLEMPWRSEVQTVFRVGPYCFGNPNMKGGCSTPRIRVYLPRELRTFYIEGKYSKIHKIHTLGQRQCNYL